MSRRKTPPSRSPTPQKIELELKYEIKERQNSLLKPRWIAQGRVGSTQVCEESYSLGTLATILLTYAQPTRSLGDIHVMEEDVISDYSGIDSDGNTHRIKTRAATRPERQKFHRVLQWRAYVRDFGLVRGTLAHYIRYRRLFE